MKYREENVKKPTTFKIALKKTNLGINLTKKVKNLLTENYKILINETEDDLNGKISTGKINTVKMVLLMKTIHRLNDIHVELSMTFFTELEQIILKFI